MATVPLNGYCELSDITGMIPFPQTIDANSTPTSTIVETWITQEFHFINTMLRKAGYIAPVVFTDNQLISGGTIRTRNAHLVNEAFLRLEDSTGSLDGAIRPGDLFKVTGDSQYYVAVNAETILASNNIVDVEISPVLRKAIAASITVTYTSNDEPEQILKMLNAFRVALRIESTLPMAGGSRESDTWKVLKSQGKELWDAIESGKTPIVGAQKSKVVTGTGMVRLERRG